MKRYILFLIFFLVISFPVFSQKENPDFNADLAKKLGADQLGMRTYVIAFLKTGPVKLSDSLQYRELMKAHLKNITKMANEGKLITAGPFLDKTELRGIYIFDVTSIEEARALTSTDPAIKAGALVMELHPWYGSAALKEMPGLHRKIQKKGFGD